MTTMEKVNELILKARKGQLSPEKIKPEADLLNDLGFDSLARMELLVLTEDAFGLTISKEDAVAARTVGQMIAYIESHKKA